MPTDGEGESASDDTRLATSRGDMTITKKGAKYVARVTLEPMPTEA